MRSYFRVPKGALEEALYRHLDQKHTAMTAAQLESRTRALLAPGVEASEQARLAHMAMELGAAGRTYVCSGDYYHPTGIYAMERYLAERFTRLAAQCPSMLTPGLVERAMASFRSAHGYSLTIGQETAVRLALARRLSLIVGGAGVGKTTVLRVIFDALAGSGGDVIPMALSGRAARRIHEATGHEAMTIASFNERFDENTLGTHSCIVIDEASMLDVLVMHRILRKVPEAARIILVGDPVQLPPIGPGVVFHALVEEPTLQPVVAYLSVVHRQDSSTGIPAVAAAIRNHCWPDLPRFKGMQDGVTVLHSIPSDVAAMANSMLDVYDALGGDRVDVRILCPTRATGVGANLLNRMAQERYRGDDAPVLYKAPNGQVMRARFFHRDRVMWTRNDYRRELMNGTLGRVWEIRSPDDDQPFLVNFEGTRHTLTVEDLAYLTLAYAITVHKAQGSQFERVIIPVFANRLLDQSLIYTALTRGVRQVVLVGDIAAAEVAVRAPTHAKRRITGFGAMLTDEAHKCGIRQSTIAEVGGE